MRLFVISVFSVYASISILGRKYLHVKCTSLPTKQLNTPVPVTPKQNCKLSPWSSRSGCLGTCGRGGRFRSRTILRKEGPGGKPCPDFYSLIKWWRCKLPKCPVEKSNDCIVTGWSPWTPCSKKCNRGKKFRIRKIIKSEKNGGVPCPTKLRDRRKCVAGKCPISTCTDGYCKNGGTCSSFLGKATCSCPANFTGATCDVDVDECLVLANPCQNGATCTNFYGGYTCRCIKGWEGVDCSINTDDCFVPLGGSPKCLSGGMCFDQVGKFDCICPPNKTGVICQFDDECVTLKPCYRDAKCTTNAFGHYSCLCSRGWSGTNCSTDIDECASSDNSPCYHGGRCVNTPGSFYCQCVPGYTGPICQFDDECVTLKPCYADAKCGTNAFGHYSCLCSRGWTGKNCSTDIDECTSSDSPCYHGGRCVNTAGSFYCQCVPGYTGERCEGIVNECKSNPCKNGALCLDLINSFECHCVPGWTGVYCHSEINECLSSPCLNGGQCHDYLNRYHCTCRLGYSGPNCQINIDDCDPNPCQNGATCIDGIAYYTCSCPTGFSGKHCQINMND